MKQRNRLNQLFVYLFWNKYILFSITSLFFFEYDSKSYIDKIAIQINAMITNVFAYTDISTKHFY